MELKKIKGKAKEQLQTRSQSQKNKQYSDAKTANDCTKSLTVSKNQNLSLLNTPQLLSSAMRRSPSPCMLPPVPLSPNFFPSLAVASIHSNIKENNIKSSKMNCLSRPTLVYPTLSIESDDGEIYHVDDFDLITQPKFIILSASSNSIGPIGDKPDNVGSKIEDDITSEYNYKCLNASDENLSTNVKELEGVEDENGN